MINNSREHALVITGASGFVGRNLLKLLVDTKINVHALLRSTKENIPRAKNITIEKVSNYTDFVPVPGSVLIHLGEPSHVANLENRGVSYISEMTKQMESLLQCGYGHVIYASSASVYDDDKDRQLFPDLNVVNKRKIYAESKLSVEKIVSAAGGTIARITNIYGEGMSNANIFSDILRQLPNDGPLNIQEATPVREYLWVMDLAKCLIAMAREKRAGIYNVSINQPISCQDLARLIVNLNGHSERAIEALHPARYSVLRLDISKTIQCFGWKPEVSLEQGISLLLKELNDG